MFGQILTLFQGFFSRAYWFGSFLPVAVVSALHVLMTAHVFPQEPPLWGSVTGTTGNALVVAPIAFGTLFVVAYALTPFIPFFRGVLDGHQLPGWLRDRLRRR